MAETAQQASDDFEPQDDLKIRRRKLIIASRSPRTKDEIDKVLKEYKKYGITYLIDEKEVVMTREFEAVMQDPNNNKITRRKEVTLTVSGNLLRPVEDFIHDARWLLSQAGAIQDAQKTVTHRRM